MDSPDGHLQALKHRLSDAQRELPRAEPDQQVRIQEDIAELKRQIAQQQSVIDNPKATERLVQQRIDVGLEGERKPAKPVTGITQSKFINPPPLIAPTWFQDRHSETWRIGEFLKDESLRLMTVVGRGGVGKSAMVCRLLRSLEGGQLPDDGGTLKVDGIVYLSAARSVQRTNLPDLYAGLTKLLPDETVKQLDSVHKNPQATPRAIMEALLQAFPRGRTVVMLDNFEDMLAIDSGQIKDAELDEALHALLELPPNGLKIIITTRVMPRDLALVYPGLQRRLDLDMGLEHPYAENILKAMDADGKVGLRNAPDELLATARERTLGYPRALEHLFGILSADRDTTLQEILDNTKMLLPEKVVAVLVGEAFSRLDPTAQRVMQALATYRYPVPPAAVDYLLQPHVSGIDSGRVLSRLVNMHFVHRDAGRYYLHQVDRDYALSRIARGGPDDRGAEVPSLTRYALQHRAAEWFKLSRKPREAWKSLDDLAAQLAEFELRLEQAIEIADNIGATDISKSARETFARVNVYRNNLAAARELMEAGLKYDVPLSNYRSSATLGLVALRQAELNTAREAFTAAINEASRLIALTADRYSALDVKGLSLCGLALCGHPAHIPAAKAAYSAARAVTSAAGITHEVLRWFDALAQADADGILAEVRPIAAGVKPE
jgi:hypothetical protein